MSADKNHYYFFNDSKQKLLADRISMANTFFARLKGLLGTTGLEEGEGILLSPCRSIHMFGMKYSIDAVFMDSSYRVIEVLHEFEPGKVSGNYKKAFFCLEVKAGAAKKAMVEPGDVLVCGPAPYRPEEASESASPLEE